MKPKFRPLPGDPGAEEIAAMFDATADDWILAAGGDYQTGAAEAMQKDGSAFQRVVILEWPGRYNHTPDEVTVRLMMHPEDALGLAEVLAHMWVLGYVVGFHFGRTKERLEQLGRRINDAAHIGGEPVKKWADKSVVEKAEWLSHEPPENDGEKMEP